MQNSNKYGFQRLYFTQCLLSFYKLFYVQTTVNGLWELDHYDNEVFIGP